MAARPRGIRNNNPLNIRRTGNDRWVGMAETQTDPQFVQFTRPEFGIRAAAIILMNYQDRYHLRSIRKIISRWAPQTENDTEAYVTAVADAVGVDPDAAVDVRDYVIARPMIDAMALFENGRPIQRRVIDDGLRLAGIVPGRPRSLVDAAQTDTARGSVAATMPTAVTGAVAAVAPQLWGIDWRVATAAVLVVAIAAVVAVLVWRAGRD